MASEGKGKSEAQKGDAGQELLGHESEIASTPINQGSSGPSSLPPLSEAQVELMNVVWERGEVTLGDLWAIVSARRSVTRNTVQTVLTRLVDKGWLRYRTEGKSFHYSATQPQEEAQRHMVQRLVQTAFGGSAESLVLTLLEGRPLAHDEAERIRALIEQAERGQAKKP